MAQLDEVSALTLGTAFPCLPTIASESTTFCRFRECKRLLPEPDRPLDHALDHPLDPRDRQPLQPVLGVVIRPCPELLLVARQALRPARVPHVVVAATRLAGLLDREPLDEVLRPVVPEVLGHGRPEVVGVGAEQDEHAGGGPALDPGDP